MWVISIITSIVTLISSIGTSLIGGGNKGITYESIETELRENGIENYRDLNEFISKRINEIMEEENMPEITYDFENGIYKDINPAEKSEDNNGKKEENTEEIPKENKFKNNEVIENEEYGAYIKDEHMNIGPNNKVLRVVMDEKQSGGASLSLEVNDYNNLKDNDNTYGYLIGPQPISLGDIYGNYEYETAMINGTMAQYPNIFTLDQSYCLEDKSTLSFKSKDKLMEFSLSNRENSGGFDVKSLYNKETGNGDVTESECGDNWFYIYLERSGVGNYSFTVFDGDRIKSFAYSFPVQYKKMFDPFIEQSRKSFYVFDGFPELKS
ncbi:hypothetical protein [Clostridium sp. LIBA-8841]|uniref:hypothetical protein n=1 Tax=Clostridium sp. LIBA-8841 TaxID=2987530 RepID=UPI002AC4E8F9|nr:hypothetical protein [Clostridium sp. LIBA-8841]MDZ5253524.1 hypothetical protein [Clostridium sp. LIBA-8841]